MQFKIDENLPVEIAEMLISAGHDALTVFDQGLQGIRDERLINICNDEARILVTLDMDFADPRAYPPQETPGIVVLRVGSQAKQHVMNVFGRVMPLFAKEVVARHLWIVEETVVRIRGEEQN